MCFTLARDYPGLSATLDTCKSKMQNTQRYYAVTCKVDWGEESLGKGGGG